MGSMKNEQLLKDPRVIEEINRHKWFESEKAGHDIGFERAAAGWLSRYSDAWIKQNTKGTVTATTKQTVVKKKEKATSGRKDRFAVTS
jgi:hypothetical protein